MSMIVKSGALNTSLPCVLYENIFTLGTVTQSDDGDYENALSGTTWDFWSGGARTLRVDLDSDVYVDCLFIDAHNLSDDNDSVTLQYWGGSDWVDYQVITPTDNSAIAFIFPEINNDMYRVLITGGDVGVLMLGKRLVFPQGVDQSHASIPHSTKYTLLGGDSINGQFIGNQVIRKGASLTVTFPLLDASWVDADMQEFEEHYNLGKPFMWAANALKFPTDFGFCQRPKGAGQLNPRYFEGGLYEEFSMQLGVYINV